MAKRTKPSHDHGSQDIHLVSRQVLDNMSMTKPSHEHGFQDNLQPLVTVKSQVMPMPKPAKPSHGHGSQEVHNLQPLDTDDNMLIAKRSKPSTKIKKNDKMQLVQYDYL